MQSPQSGGEPLTAAGVGLASSMKSLEAKISNLVSIQKVLAAVDLSNHSEATAMYAAELAKSFGCFPDPCLYL